MKADRFDAKRLFRAAEAVARVVEPAELFGLLSRSVDLPPDWAALRTRRTRERVFCKPGTELSPDDDADILLLRTSPLSIAYEGITTPTADGYQCVASVNLRVSLVPETSEATSFRNVILSSGRYADVSAVAQYLRPHIAAALARCSEGRGVEVLINARAQSEINQELTDELKRPTFSAGLKVDSFTVGFDSPVYRQVHQSRAQAARRREEFAARRRIEQATEAAQQQHAQHLADLLTKLRGLAGDSPEVDLPDLLKSFSERDRGELYQALFAAGDTESCTETIVAAAGLELLFFRPGSYAAPQRRVSLPDTVGPLRSVQSGTGPDGGLRLFAGAAQGVLEMDPEGDGPGTVYRLDTDQPTRGGINSVAVAGDRVVASHSELGLLAWRRGCGDGPERLLPERTRRAQAVRGACFLDGDTYFSIDHEVCRLRLDDAQATPTTFRGSGSLITAVCPTAEGLYAGNADGQILCWAPNGAGDPQVLHSGGRRPAESVAVLDFGEVKRLFYTDTSIAVFARVLGDSFICRYEAGGQTLLRVEVAPGLVVATNEVRDRLICWAPGAPGAPSGIVPVARLTGRSVQDVCLLPAKHLA